jgi:hypothetical protein
MTISTNIMPDHDLRNLVELLQKENAYLIREREVACEQAEGRLILIQKLRAENERLLRERDEARAKALDEAADVAFGNGKRQYTGKPLYQEIAEAILALKDKP